MLSNPSRRSVLGALFYTFLIQPAVALTQTQAESFVDSMVNDVQRAIALHKNEQALIGEFKKIFTRNSDLSIMARYVLGVDARRATSAQKHQFEQVFSDYIVDKYGKQFRIFIGATVKIKTARKIRAGYEVKTNVALSGRQPFEVAFLLSDKSGKIACYNMLIEGVNLLLNERSEIGALTDRNKGNLDAMIQDLAQRT